LRDFWNQTRKKLKKIFQASINYLLYVLLKITLRISKYLPYEFCLKAGAFIGSLTYLILSKIRKIILDNLEIAFGKELYNEEKKKLAREIFIEQGKNAFELFKIDEITSRGFSNFVKIEGIENLDSALSYKKGVIFISGHFGNWELLAISIAQLGYSSYPYMRKINNKYIDKLLNDTRMRFKLKPIDRDGIQAVKSGLRVLNNNEILGMLIDQDTTRIEGVFVDFFGRLAYTPSGAASLAIASGCPIIFGFIKRGIDNKHTVTLSKPIFAKITGDKKADIFENTQIFNRYIEEAIRENPSQWVFMHRRWKHTPENIDE
jgi:Kdo2-lipid IVA lauroyltransferase/acyltransferase